MEPQFHAPVTPVEPSEKADFSMAASSAHALPTIPMGSTHRLRTGQRTPNRRMGMRIARVLALTCAIGLAIVGTSSATTYDAVANFSATNGPPSNWSYGFGVTGLSFTPYSTFSPSGVCQVGGVTTGLACWNTGNNSVPEVGINTTGTTLTGGTVVVPTGVLLLHPDTVLDTIVQFTVPVGGAYNISGLFEILDTSPTGIIGLVTLNGTNLFAGPLAGPGASGTSPGGSETFLRSRILQAGDILDFGVNNGGLYLFDSTGLSATISPTPEPVTMFLGGTGLLAFTYAARKRILRRSA
jgi:hypothetical protein